MNMGQILPFIAATTTIVGVMVGLLIRSMSAQRAELSAKIDGTHEKIGSGQTLRPPHLREPRPWLGTWGRGGD